MDGLLIVDKPAGLTSHDVVARVRHLLNHQRTGHTGTLDPFATGVLVVLVGRATRLAQFLSGLEKEYEAIIRLGYSTDTGDVTGAPLEDQYSRPATLWTKPQIEAALESLRGEIDQVPPMYSAKKQDGRRLYEVARRGEEVERQPVRVCIHQFEAIKPSGELLKDNLDGTFDLDVRVACSAGTYIRTLAEDFGKQLSVGAHLVELRRTRVGDFDLKQAQTLEQLKMNVAEESIGKALLTPTDALTRLSSLKTGADDIRRVRHGLNLKAEAAEWGDGEPVKLVDETGRLVAVGIFNAAEQTLHPKVVLATDSQ